MTTWVAGEGPWQCGACGGIHGWSCPYFGGPGRFNPAPYSRKEGTKKRDEDRKAKRGAFSHLKETKS